MNEGLRAEFQGYMEASNLMADDMPDGAWLCMLEDSAAEFCEIHGLKDNPYRLAREFLKGRFEH